MKNAKIISKLARYFSIVSFVFVILSAIITFYLLQIGSPTAPIEYVVFVILSSVVPYLFIAVLSLVIAILAGGMKTDNSEKEEQSPAPREAVNA